MRINSHLGAGGVMTPGRIQDPEGAKTVIISFKTAARTIAAIHMQTYTIVCFKDAAGGRLRVDAAATTGGKQDPSKQGLRSILTYKSHMYTEASIDPERCIHKSDQMAMNMWVANYQAAQALRGRQQPDQPHARRIYGGGHQHGGNRPRRPTSAIDRDTTRRQRGTTHMIHR
jgi:hypothetical protein